MKMQRITIFLSLVVGLLLIVGSGVAAPLSTGKVSLLQGAHADSKVMPRSCRSCHRGMAIAISGEEGTCLNCHGPDSARQAMVQYGFLSPEASLDDLSREFAKPYRHPTMEVAGVHRQDEILPETMVDVARHAECVDCHNPHLVEAGSPFRGLKGKRVGNFKVEVAEEFELCYRCHAESPNLPVKSTNKHGEFKPTNPSYHPVEAEGKNLYVISLKSPYVAQAEKPGDVSRLSCSSCHGSDDPSAPKGPHGSLNKGLLKLRYDMADGGSSSEMAFELCYSCHDRASILGDESFPLHSLHIQGRQLGQGSGTSCFTCHDAHGSSRYQFLIRFNEEVVQTNADGKLEFKAQGTASRHGSCLLNCHGVEHNPKSY